MSGGSWDYLGEKLTEAADRLQRSRDPQRRALGKQMARMADAMHAIEWVDSADYSPGDENEPIAKALGTDAPKLIAVELLQEANAIHKKLEAAIRKLAGLT